MLTGDMLDTAVSIGKSCCLLTPAMEGATIMLSKSEIRRQMGNQITEGMVISIYIKLKFLTSINFELQILS